MAAVVLVILEDALWSGLAALGFAIAFNVPPRLLWGCVLAGASGHALRTGLIAAGLAIEPSTLIAASLVGFIAQGLAKQLHAPAPAFAISGSIPMVPGLFAYNAMIGIIQATIGDPLNAPELLVSSAVNFIRVALILGAIATGIVLPTLLFLREKPVV